MNHENEVKVRLNLPDRHEHLTITPYTKYTWPITVSIWKNTKPQKNKYWSRTKSVRSKSDDTCQIDMHTLQS